MSKTLTMATRLNPDPITTSKTHKFWYQGSFAVLNLSLEVFFCCFPICVTMVEWTFEDCESRKVHKSQFIQFPFLLKTTIWAKKTGGTNCKRMNYASHEMGNMTKTVAADLDKPSSSLHLYVETCDIWRWMSGLPTSGLPPGGQSWGGQSWVHHSSGLPTPIITLVFTLSAWYRVVVIATECVYVILVNIRIHMSNWGEKQSSIGPKNNLP